MIDFAAAGLGLDYGSVRLVRASAQWPAIGRRLVAEIRAATGDLVEDVEHVGSTAVPGLLAKPVVDVALAVRPGIEAGQVAEALRDLGWIHRGDAGDDGGWVFVLEDAPWHRVAHAHGVDAGGGQWRRYLEFRDLLHHDAGARRAYEAAKVRLARLHALDATAYTSGKGPTVERLLTGDREA